jgi:hypothetical protein
MSAILRDRDLRDHVARLRCVKALLGVINDTRFDGSVDIAESDITRAQHEVECAADFLEDLRFDGDV